MSKQGLLIFVEGETDFHFINKMNCYLINKNTNKQQVDLIKIKNLDGIGNYKKKASRLLRNLQKKENINFRVICFYDSDVFELSKKPPLDWNYVFKELNSENPISIDKVAVKKMIEDWLLLDKKGLCKYLKLDEKKSRNLNGKDGNEKMKSLFKKSNKIYQKGAYCERFLEDLDFNLIYKNISKEIACLEKYLFKQ
ncbi:hypothetical protein ABEX00_12605 [Bacillus safensis]|uniref:hypothetical protein n=1 Tax=Bacillus TaxID=1386 RepID=UPI000260AC90|nr:MULTISPECIES: hypothetical protein [Bacillus]EIL83121.1 hypothetical protein BAME_38500 [Bacillus sp. M 2-6]KJF47129.1 hypothetical protein BAIE_12830 [Bacillus altitudinis]MEC0471192.1 hypothetical protein [Bacillus altitudinis]